MVNPDHICWGGEHRHTCSHVLEVRDLAAAYGKTDALSGVSFRIHCGHTLALIGPNGAGKSTLINVLAGLIRPDRGQVLWNGSSPDTCRREFAYLPQRTEIDMSFPLTVRALVSMGRYPMLGPWRSPGPHDVAIVDRALEALDLVPLQQRQIGQLSGGQLQRSLLARAVAQEAHILLLDEPFTGLDEPGTASLAELLRSLAAEGRLIIASHHNLQNAADIFDRTLLLHRETIAYGPTTEVLTPHNIQRAFAHTAR